MNNQMMAKVIITMSALLVLALGGCGTVNDSVLTANGPAFPSGLTASPGNGQVVLTWFPIQEATSYNVYWSTVPGVDKATGTKISNITSTLYTHTTVTNGVIYYYVVTAVDNNKRESDNSEEVSAMPAATLGIWTTKASMRTAREGMTSSVASNGTTTSIYVFNGLGANGHNLSSVEMYSTATDTWTSLSSSATNTAMRYQTSSVVNNNIYLIGGIDINNFVSNAVVQYTPTTNTWTTRASMPTSRSVLASCATSTMIYVIGGWNGSSTVNTVEIYSASTNSWTTKAPMTTSRYYITCSTVGSVIYVFGGKSSSTGPALATVEAYDTVNNTWSTKKAMPTARQGMTSSVVGTKVYVIGGYNSNFGVLSTVEVYDTVSDSWASVEAMPTARNVLTSSVVGTNIYAIGGYDGFEDVNTVEMFTP